MLPPVFWFWIILAVIIAVTAAAHDPVRQWRHDRSARRFR
jgi:hypothetical protein